MQGLDESVQLRVQPCVQRSGGALDNTPAAPDLLVRNQRDMDSDGSVQQLPAPLFEQGKLFRCDPDIQLLATLTTADGVAHGGDCGLPAQEPITEDLPDGQERD